ncbi:MAG TPA: tetratricopeptide repeat protein, partial [Pirellulales bacterium]|nr:tetratricopeptide repeat protein [Pirellulales bacterium]
MAIAIAVIYGQTLGYPLLSYDDSQFVWENPQVKNGFTSEGIHWAFTSGPYGEWYPLSPLSHMLDCELFGSSPKAFGKSAWGHHLTNVLLHAATSIALFLFWWRLTGELWPSAFVAALFAVHPQHVESVAWVAERKDVLSGLFFVLTLAAWLGYLRHGRSLLRYLWVAVLFALGLMSKPMIVTLPAVLLLLDYWPLGRLEVTDDLPEWARSAMRPGALRPGAMRLVLEKLPLVALSVLDALLTVRTHNYGTGTIAGSERFAVAANAGVDYVLKFVLPIDLAAIYPLPPVVEVNWQVIGAVVIEVAVSAAAVAGRRRWPWLFVGWFWYLVMLTPVLGVVQSGFLAMADRYMYLPSIGLSVAVAWGGLRLAGASAKRRRVLGGIAAATVVVLSICATWQASFWCNDETLWRHSLASTIDNPQAETNLADALAEQDRFDEAAAHYELALNQKTWPVPFTNMAAMRIRQKRFDEAQRLLEQALEIEPGAAAAHGHLGAILAQQGQFAAAEEHLRRACELEANNAQFHYTLAFVLVNEKRMDDAVREFARAVELDPANAMYQNHLAATLAQLGQLDA